MSFVPMDGFLYSGIILSICSLLQPVIVTSNPICLSKVEEVKNVWTNSSSVSSVLVSWDYPSYEYNESDTTTVPTLYLRQGDHLLLEYSPCRYESWPTLVYDPVTSVYLAKYNVDESFYSPKTMNLSRVKSYLIPPTRIRIDVAKLPFPGWPYAFRLDAVISSGGTHGLAKILGRTYPATPIVCGGCFSILWTRPQEQKREVRVYWPRRVGQRISFLLSVSEKGSSNYRTTLVEERGISDDTGYVDVVISMRSHIFRFSERGQYARPSSNDSIIIVPDEQNLFEWVPDISTTIDSNITRKMNTITKTRILSWKKPKYVNVVEYYTLVWYDKIKWRENPDLSPIMDWIYISGNLTSIKFRVVDSTEDDDGRVGWQLIANTVTSSSGLQNFTAMI